MTSAPAVRQLVCRVTISDCEVQTFRAGGPGGQKQNKTDSAVRIIHHPSGARAESRTHREQWQNKRTAFRRMAESHEFQRWAMSQAGMELAVAEPPSAPEIRIRTYNMVDRYVKDHRTGAKTSKVAEVLDGNLDLLDG